MKPPSQFGAPSNWLQATRDGFSSSAFADEIISPAFLSWTFCERTNKKWEYKTIKLGATGLLGGKIDDAKRDRTMNELGVQGWELGAALDTDVAGGGTRDVVVIFKRPMG